MSEQTALPEYVSETPTNTTTITRTVKCKLNTSERKNERLREVIDEWQSLASRFANLLPTFSRQRWGDVQKRWQNRLAPKEFPTDEIGLRAHDRNQALYKVSEAFGSWNERGCPGNRPQGQFGDGNYLRLCHCGVTVEENDRGYGVKLGLQPYKPEWFHISAGEYQREYLNGIVDNEYSTGSAEVHLTDGGAAYLHLTVSRDIDVYEPQAVPRYVGVDVVERVIYAAAAVDVDVAEGRDGIDVQSVTMERGREFRHHREQLQKQKDRLQRQGDLRAVRDLRNQRERYTNHVIGRASREVVDFARNHAPCAIVIEEMGDYRETAEDPIHDWPRGQLQEEITYKATAERIPVIAVNPAGTSVTCRNCGQTDVAARDKTEFACRRCLYEVHADVNAAINIGYEGANAMS
jgi:IS605 OrfB family transposase